MSENLNISQLANLMDCNMRTAVKRLQGHKCVESGNSKLYKSSEVLMFKPASETVDAEISYAEAQRRLAIAREREIALGMEVTRKERVPLTLVSQVMSEAAEAQLAILKSHKGKTLTDEVLDDILQRHRDAASKIAGVNNG